MTIFCLKYDIENSFKDSPKSLVDLISPFGPSYTLYVNKASAHDNRLAYRYDSFYVRV